MATDVLTSFHDFQIATQEVQVTKLPDLINEATYNTYLLDLMLKDTDVKKMLQGGKRMRNEIQGGHGSTYAAYSPGDEESPQASNNLVKTETAWSFNRSYYVYDEEETDLNEGDTTRWRNLKRSYELGCVVDTVNGMEDQLFATPDKTKMEDIAGTNNATAPYSLLAFNTQDGEVPSTSNGGVANGNWTTLLQVNPDSNSWWKNKTATYDASTPDDADDGLVKAFSKMVLKTKFEMPNAVKKYSDPDQRQMRKQKILTNEDGHTFYEARLRQLNDNMRVINDPHIDAIQYRGIPVEYIAKLDSAGWTTGQPDYLFYNFNFIYPVFHTKWFMRQKMTDGGSSQPNRHTVWKFVWWNLTCESRRRQGRVYHSAA